MIFITLGSQKFQFNRLLKAVDELVKEGKLEDNIYAQIGFSDYRPINYQYSEFLDRTQYEKVMNDADIVITHGGTGAIVGALKKGKKVVAVARRMKYGEHVDDHQLQLIEEFEKAGLICRCDDVSKLDLSIIEATSRSFNVFVSNTRRIVESIDSFIDKI